MRSPKKLLSKEFIQAITNADQHKADLALAAGWPIGSTPHLSNYTRGKLVRINLLYMGRFQRVAALIGFEGDLFEVTP